MPTILITGASGFVGRMTAEKFRDRGWNVVGIGRRETTQPGYIQADLSIEYDDRVVQALKRADLVLHAAARSSPWGTRRSFRRANVLATERLLDACDRHGRPRVVFVSSSSVYYRECDQFGLTESSPLADHPVNHYAESKQLAERLVESYQGSSLTVRPRAVYGRGDTVLFPRILAAARAGKLPLLTRDDEPAVGDLIAIENLTERFWQIAQDETLTGSLNLTDNDPQRIIPFLLDVFHRLDLPTPKRKVPVRRAYRFAHGVECLYGCLMPWKEPPITRFGVHVFAYSKTFDVSRMLELLGPPPQTTETAVAEFVDWIRSRPC
ncbi:MAG: NAD(P)-dependent oxidoreductase [Planctomycetota bacterium]